MKTPIRFFEMIFALLCLALLQNAQAVNPPPDGGYPGFNTAEGQNALLSLDTSTGLANTAVGWFSLKSSVDASFNTAVGAGTLVLNSGDQNTAIGAAALLLNTIGSFNTAVGAVALLNNAGGDFNTATGTSALERNTEGDNNTATGTLALQTNIDGHDNTAVGFLTLSANTGGGSNTAVGSGALASNSTGFNNIAIGAASGGAIVAANNVICIGANLEGADVSNSCYIDSIFNQTSASGVAVFVNANGRLGTMTSSQRFKEDIQPMDQASEALFSLKPVSFRYKKDIDPAGIVQLGLVAEDVEKVNPALVVRDKEGKPYSVRYDQVNAMLLNEFLKEHGKIETQQATITELKSAMAQQREDFEAAVAQQQKTTQALIARLNEQEARIQSAQLQVGRPASPMLVENH